MTGMRRYADESLVVFWRCFKSSLEEAIPHLDEGDLHRCIIPALAQAVGYTTLRASTSNGAPGKQNHGTAVTLWMSR